MFVCLARVSGRGRRVPCGGGEGGEGAELWKTLRLPVLRAQVPWLERAAAPCSRPLKVSTEPVWCKQVCGQNRDGCSHMVSAQLKW